METVTGNTFELIKMQQALGFSSKIESVLQNLWTLYLQGDTYRGLWLLRLKRLLILVFEYYFGFKTNSPNILLLSKLCLSDYYFSLFASTVDYYPT